MSLALENHEPGTVQMQSGFVEIYGSFWLSPSKTTQVLLFADLAAFLGPKSSVSAFEIRGFSKAIEPSEDYYFLWLSWTLRFLGFYLLSSLSISFYKNTVYIRIILTIITISSTTTYWELEHVMPLTNHLMNFVKANPPNYPKGWHLCCTLPCVAQLSSVGLKHSCLQLLGILLTDSSSAGITFREWKGTASPKVTVLPCRQLAANNWPQPSSCQGRRFYRVTPAPDIWWSYSRLRSLL